MASGMGAASGADMLQNILRRRLAEAAQQAQVQQVAAALAERVRENDMQNTVAHRGLDLGERRIGEDSRQFDVASGQRDRTIRLDEQAQPVRIKQMEAQTGEILRKPQAEQQERDFVTGRDKTQHGYSMQQIGAQGANALRVANVRHPDSGTAAQQAQATNEQNEVDDAIALIQQIRDDKARTTATGPVQGGLGLGMVQDPEGYTRVKALHDNLVNKMALAQAGKLKGQGTISNFERDMLAKAATALQRGLGDQDYLNELGKVEEFFQRKRGGTAPRGNMQTGGPVNLKSAAQEFDYVPGKGLVPRGGQ